MFDLTDTKFSLDELMSIHAAGTYLVRAAGDSMVNVGIFDGDILVVDKSRAAQNGEIIIAAIEREPLVKIYHKKPDGQIILSSANAKYPPRYVLEAEDFWIWGVVSHSIRAHGKY